MSGSSLVLPIMRDVCQLLRCRRLVADRFLRRLQPYTPSSGTRTGTSGLEPAAWFALGWITARIAEVRALAKPVLSELAHADPPKR